jgi:fumarate reductase subunit D
MTTSPISHTVMKRVHRIHTLRLVFSPLSTSMILFLISLSVFGREVWVAHVIQNLSNVHTPESLFTFFVSAFINTRFVVQVVTILMAGAGVWFTYGIKRLLTNATPHFV